MLDTEREAFVKSLNFYIHHSKELEYPWWDELADAETREQLASSVVANHKLWSLNNERRI